MAGDVTHTHTLTKRNWFREYRSQVHSHLLRIFSACSSEMFTPRSRRDCIISWESIRPTAQNLIVYSWRKHHWSYVQSLVSACLKQCLCDQVKYKNFSCTWTRQWKSMVLRSKTWDISASADTVPLSNFSEISPLWPQDTAADWTNKPLVAQWFLTIVLLVQTLEDKAEFLLVVSEIMNKLLKVQLSIQVFVPCLHYFL